MVPDQRGTRQHPNLQLFNKGGVTIEDVMEEELEEEAGQGTTEAPLEAGDAQRDTKSLLSQTAGILADRFGRAMGSAVGKHFNSWMDVRSNPTLLLMVAYPLLEFMDVRTRNSFRSLVRHSPSVILQSPTTVKPPKFVSIDPTDLNLPPIYKLDPINLYSLFHNLLMNDLVFKKSLNYKALKEEFELQKKHKDHYVRLRQDVVQHLKTKLYICHIGHQAPDVEKYWNKTMYVNIRESSPRNKEDPDLKRHALPVHNVLFPPALGETPSPPQLSSATTPHTPSTPTAPHRQKNPILSTIPESSESPPTSPPPSPTFNSSTLPSTVFPSSPEPDVSDDKNMPTGHEEDHLSSFGPVNAGNWKEWREALQGCLKMLGFDKSMEESEPVAPESASRYSGQRPNHDEAYKCAGRKLWLC
ncbi:hypothetical protein P7C70_g8885, partial [Phenoliferia sp. Uapishka_3]